uniref:Uncharacterized protein n=1 Tax=Romanomermis culicivorax TaxID=13658 RepID=A0A915L3P4_ROMCU
MSGMVAIVMGKMVLLTHCWQCGKIEVGTWVTRKIGSASSITPVTKDLSNNDNQVLDSLGQCYWQVSLEDNSCQYKMFRKQELLSIWQPDWHAKVQN